MCVCVCVSWGIHMRALIYYYYLQVLGLGKAEIFPSRYIIESINDHDILPGWREGGSLEPGWKSTTILFLF
jgi:hypothetical protein